MKLIALTISLFLPLSALAGAYDVKVPILDRYAQSYVVVGVAGFKTIKSDDKDIFSKTLSSDGQDSGVWSNLPDRHNKIYKRAFLTHYSEQSEIDQVIGLFLDSSGKCNPNIGLIIMANSWGAENGNKLGKTYYQKCQRLPDVFIMIDGIAKPLVGTYTSPVWAYNCFNFFQKDAFLHGASIVNCMNQQITTGYSGDLYKAHVSVEWSASDTAADLIKKYLDEKLAPNWVKDLGVNYLKKLYDYPERTESNGG